MTRPLTLHAHEVRRLQAAGGVTLWRPVKPQPEAVFHDGRIVGWQLPGGVSVPNVDLDLAHSILVQEHVIPTCPHGAPGETRWVREVWRIIPLHSDYVLEYEAAPQLQRRSVHPDTAAKASMTGQWRSPVTMPRWASRYSLTVQAVTVKRTTDLDDGEAMDAGWDDPQEAHDPRRELLEWYAAKYPNAPWCWGVAVTLAAA